MFNIMSIKFLAGLSVVSVPANAAAVPRLKFHDNNMQKDLAKPTLKWGMTVTG